MPFGATGRGGRWSMEGVGRRRRPASGWDLWSRIALGIPTFSGPVGTSNCSLGHWLKSVVQDERVVVRACMHRIDFAVPLASLLTMSSAPAAAGGRSAPNSRGGLASGSISRILDEASSGCRSGGGSAGQTRRRSRSTSPHPPASAGSHNNTAPAKSKFSSSTAAAAAAAELCSFCSEPAALSVSSSLISRPYCLTHYYTSRAVRAGTANPNKVHILGPDGSEIFGIDTSSAGNGEESEPQSEMAKQLPAMQEMFAEAFTSLRDRIANKLSGGGGFAASASSSTSSHKSGKKRGQTTSRSGSAGGGVAAKRNAHDPLADLLGGPSLSSSTGSGKKRARKRPPSERPANPKPPASTPREDNEGGFVRDVQLPSRYAKQQRKMAQAEVAERRRLMSAGAGRPAGAGSKGPPSRSAAASTLSHVETNPYKRRKPSRSSIWNLAMDGDAGTGSATSNSANSTGRQGSAAPSTGGGASAAKSSWDAIEQAMRPTVLCTCGSTDVSNDLNITGRGNDMPKGETWGFKDRSDVVVRYRCGHCGKTWNEEE